MILWSYDSMLFIEHAQVDAATADIVLSDLSA